MDKDTITEIRLIWNKLSEIERKLSDFTDSRHSESMKHINESEDVLDGIMTEIIPETAESLSEIADTLDDLMTNVIPSLMENNAES